MKSKIQNKEIKIVVVDSSAPVRQLLATTLREMGYQNVEGMASPKDAIGKMETEPVDWIITNLFDDEPVTAFHILEIILSHSFISHIKISLLLTSDEIDVLPAAVERGVLGWFEKPFNKTTIKEELSKFLIELEEAKNEIKFIYDRYDTFLGDQNKHEERERLSKQLLHLYAGDPDYLENLVDTYVKQGKLDLARILAKQMVMIEPKVKPKVVALLGDIFDEEEGADETGSLPKENIINLNHVVAIDGDDASMNSVTGWLTSLGVPNIHSFSDGEKAWEHIKQADNIDCIISEWKIKELSGPQLIQRIREQDATVPIVIHSGILEHKDKALMHEMGVCQLIPKPCERTEFLHLILGAIQSERMPKDMSTIERKIRMAIVESNEEELGILEKKYLISEEVPETRKNKIRAEIFYYRGNYEQAKHYASEALKTTTDSIMILNLLGKIMIKTGDLAASLKFFDKAQQMSPLNITRLCMIAQTESELQNNTQAHETLEKAEILDSKSSTVQKTSAQIAINEGDVSKAKSILSGLNSIREVITYLNNKAVALAKSGKANESNEFYQNAFEAIPDDQNEYKSVVKYNMTLAMIRQQKIEEALTHIKDALSFGETKVSKKAANIKSIIERSIATGRPIPLSSTQQQGEQADDALTKIKPENQEVVTIAEVTKGSYGLYKIYHTESLDAKSIKMIAKKPVVFNARDSIRRAQNFLKHTG